MIVFFVHSSEHDTILYEENCSVLVNYTYMIEQFPKEPEIPYNFPKVIIDSGGFQMHHGTKESSLEAYTLWLQMLLPKHPEVLGYFVLDEIGNAEVTRRNQMLMEIEGLHPIPIWHDGEDPAILEFYANNYEWMAIGGLAGKLKSKGYYTKLVNLITQTYPKTKFHLLGIGITGAMAFQQARVFSVDFSTWSAVARWGNMVVFDKKQMLKEIRLPDADRERLRKDKEYREHITRVTVQNIRQFEKTLNEMKDTDHQLIIPMRGI